MLCKLYRAGPQPGDRAYLASLGVKDLKDYLVFLEVPSQRCISKTDLVDLIVGVTDVRRGCRPKATGDAPRPHQSSAAPRPHQSSAAPRPHQSSAAASASLPLSSARTHGQPSSAADPAGVSRSSARDVNPTASSSSSSNLAGAASGVRRPGRRRSSSGVAAAPPSTTAGGTPPSLDGSWISVERPPSAHVSSSVPEGGAMARGRPSSTAPMPSSLPGPSGMHDATAAAAGGGASVRHGHRVDLSAIHAEDVTYLSVMQLKETLAVNFVDFRGCVEKKELVELVMRLWMERHPLPGQATNEQDDSMMSADADCNECRICMDEPINCVLLECGHMCCCVVCGRKLAECPMCRRYVSRVVHVFKT